MVEPRPLKQTVKFVDEYCLWYKKLFSDVRNFEAFKYLHIGCISELKPKSLPEIAKIESCQAHFLNNLSDAVLPLDTKLKQQLKVDLDGLPKVPQHSERPSDPTGSKQLNSNSPFFHQSPICQETQS